MHAVTSPEGLPETHPIELIGRVGSQAVPIRVRHTALLLADPDHARCDRLAADFEADGYEVFTASSVPAAAEILLGCRVAVLIVNAALVEGPASAVLTDIRSGPSFVARLAARQRARSLAGSGPEPTKLWEHGQLLDPDMPIIVTANRRDDLACIRALDAGGDDYLAPPFTYMELRARVRALLRRQARGSRRARLRVGALEIDAVSRQAWVSGERLRLSGKEFALLHTLATEPTRLFSREDLLRIIWGWTPQMEGVARANTRTLDSHASRLRRKLRAAGVEFLLNVWGSGYKLCDASSLHQPGVPAELAVIEIVEVPAAAA